MNFDKIISDATKNRWNTELYTACSFCEKKYTFNEFMNLDWCWVDPNNHDKYGKETLCDCGVKLSTERWSIVSRNDNYFVSTIHLPIACAGVEFENWFDYSYWYETMFWHQEDDKPREMANFQKRYHTREEAIIGHKFVVENLTKIVEHPERFPQSVLGMFVNSIDATRDQMKTIDPHVKDNLT